MYWKRTGISSEIEVRLRSKEERGSGNTLFACESRAGRGFQSNLPSSQISRI